MLPDDSAPDPQKLEEIGQKISRAVNDAKNIGVIAWTPEAAIRWRKVYEELCFPDTNDSNLLALLERGAPMVRRIAMIYALLDGTGTVSIKHLDAAVAVWKYAAATWRLIYREVDSRSDLAKAFFKAITEAGKAGCSTSDLRKVAGSNATPKERIHAAIRELAATGSIQSDSIKVLTEAGRSAGRPATVWRLAKYVGTGVADAA